ncbi:MAG: CZB domain-containing protein [Rhodospirillaceae bacterium]
MKVKVTFDVSMARLVHLDWLVRIERAMAQGQGGAPAAIQYYRDCELGIWLHGEARTRYRGCEDIKRLTVEHRRFHHAVEHALIALHDGDSVKTREYLVGAQHISKDIIYLLTLVELRNLEFINRPSLARAVISSIGGFFDPHPRWLEPPANKNASVSLDITYARLAHLRWAAGLDRGFRNYGKGVALQSHDSCEFGSWIQRIGLKKYGDMREIPLLDIVHREFHEAAARIIRCLQDRMIQRADEAYADVQNLSREIAYLLTLIEFQLDDGIRRETPAVDHDLKAGASPCYDAQHCSHDQQGKLAS